MNIKFGKTFSLCILLIIGTLLITGCDSPDSSNPVIIRTPVPEIEIESPGIVEILSDLEGLSLHDFFESSFHQISLRNPEILVTLGLERSAGLEEETLNDISDEYLKDTQVLESGILEILRDYDRDSLSQEDQVSYDVYEWYLDDLVRGHEFMYNDYPVTFFLFSVHNSTEFFFRESHPILDKQDAENYVTRLSLVEKKFDQLIEGLKIREELGIIPPRYTLQWGLPAINGIANATPTHTSFYSAFNEKLNALTELSATDKEALLDSAEAAVEESVIPAYVALNEYINELIDKAPSDDGVWQYENGEAYYEYTLRHHTSTDLTPDEIHELGLQQLERIHAEMREIFDELGYPQDESLFELFQRAAQDGGIIPSSEMVETYETIIDEITIQQSEVFDTIPKADVIVIGAPVGGFYSAGSLDGSRPGAFYATQDGRGEPYYLMPSLAYHETIPGHHTQVALAQENNLPTFRNFIELNGYVEGWALYAERLAWEMGMFDDDPLGDLGRLQYEALRAARLVVDTGIHAKGWDFNQATQFFMENVGWDRQACEYEIARYIVYHGQATAYMIGMLKILELRQMAMDQLGDQFDLKEFHHVVLSNGSVPLLVLENIIKNYIADTLAAGA